MKDPYKSLGVPKTAKKPAIKRAYNKRARETHPDRNPGDKSKEAEFKEVHAAYKLLTDDSRRERFDKTGETEEPKQVVNGPEQILAQVFASVMTDIISSGKDPATTNLVELMRMVLFKAGNELAARHKLIGKNKAVLKRTMGRFTTDGTSNIFETVLARELAGLEQQAVPIDAAIAANKAASDMLKKFTYRHDQESVSTVTLISSFGGAWSRVSSSTSG